MSILCILYDNILRKSFNYMCQERVHIVNSVCSLLLNHAIVSEYNIYTYNPIM